ncbi:dTDP-6-deoxy-L-talose 4-dehydrogenase [NAD(P)+] [Prauserella shujinwangii]|uniref:dTDP-6-deoxy-L-talose 4-dehydrogenase [NAD(P)+] n=1 Tax=Prauserella shujinwangii TaxID=1453103 RepID=A0A2T0M3Z7_9PSEU|nr:NAD(P)-dependent oxidoreductase [Prauserella shujinwangii]PRX51450.1 dTDP-6-deoxy-L-talose 4-dehydrogenase [NAD(P)+] [Prauserella shujinwangii]
MDRVVVLGGTGFVGRHLADAFAAAGHDVLVVARHQVPTPHPFASFDVAAATGPSFAAFLDGMEPDVVVDATGSSWGLGDEEMTSRCLVPTRRLLAALRHVRLRPRVVHLGSVLEYGPVPPGTPVNHGSAPPETAYGKAKLAASTALLAAAGSGRADAVVLRLSNAIGPGMPGESLVGRVLRALRSAAPGEPAVVRLKPLEAHRDYLDVRDVAEAVVAAAVADVSGQVLDIGSGKAVPVRDLVRLVVGSSGIPARIEEEPPARRDWWATMSWIEVDPTRAREVLGWRPRHDLGDTARWVWAGGDGGDAARQAGSTGAVGRVPPDREHR